MSLLGRLEDLSLTDIVQIVFLSRRTGVLEIVDGSGRHTVIFRGGLVVNASSPEHPDLVTYLAHRGLIPAEHVRSLRQMEEGGVPYGAAVLEMNLLSQDDLAAAIKSRIVDVVAPLLESREGEFNFILSESMDALDIEYDPSSLFKEGGLAPQRILGGDGEKIKPLRGLEESLKAGKALLRGSAPSAEPPRDLRVTAAAPTVDFEASDVVDQLDRLGESLPAAPAAPVSPPDPVPEPEPAPVIDDNVLPFPVEHARRDEGSASSPETEESGFGALAEEDPFADLPEAPPSEPAPRPSEREQEAGRFKVAGGLFEIETPEAQYRNVVLFERNPLVRVAAKRAFTKRNVKIFQYGSIEDVRAAMTELFQSNSFFVTFLELPGDESAVRLMQQLKRKNPRLPVVAVDNEVNLRRRHDLLKAGVDLYLTKPAPERLIPGLAEEELALFADELVLFAERAFSQWEEVTGGLGPEAGKKFYEIASKNSVERSFNILKQLINELSNPNDISQVSATILRLSAEYLDRGALFMIGESSFEGLGGFGVTGGGEEMDARVRHLALSRQEPSILADVAVSGVAHRGKMKKTPVNVQLIEELGGVLPTEVLALPIMHTERAIGILYGDNAEHHAPIDSVTGLEIFLKQAGYAFGNAVFATERNRR